MSDSREQGTRCLRSTFDSMTEISRLSGGKVQPGTLRQREGPSGGDMTRRDNPRVGGKVRLAVVAGRGGRVRGRRQLPGAVPPVRLAHERQQHHHGRRRRRGDLGPRLPPRLSDPAVRGRRGPRCRAEGVGGPGRNPLRLRPSARAGGRAAAGVPALGRSGSSMVPHRRRPAGGSTCRPPCRRWRWDCKAPRSAASATWA